MKIANRAARVAFAFAGAVSAIAFAPEAKAEDIKLCSGAAEGNYDFAAGKIKTTMGSTPITIVPSAGSWDNLKKMRDGQCNAAIAQEDAIILFQSTNNMPLDPLSNLYPETLHLVCNNTAGIGKLTDLMDQRKRLSLGEPESGPWVTWQNIVKAEPRYASNVPETSAGIRAASKVSQGVTDCFLAVSGEKSAVLNSIDAEYGQTTSLVKVRDGDLQGPRDMTGRQPLYPKATIMEGSYPNWNPKVFWGNNNVSTVSVMSKVVVDPTRLTGKQQNDLLAAINRAKPAILDRIGPK